MDKRNSIYHVFKLRGKFGETYHLLCTHISYLKQFQEDLHINVHWFIIFQKHSPNPMHKCEQLLHISQTFKRICAQCE